MTLSYELAKELKDAGFLSGSGEEYISTGPFEQWFYPTLSELIEACGDGYFSLVHTIDDWAAHMGLEEDIPWHTGPTPEEAVARLWLALNKHHG